MTNKEAIEIIEIAIKEVEWEYPMDYAAAFDIAIEALEKQSHICNNCKYFDKDYNYTCTEVHLCTKHKIARYEDAFCSDWECD